MKSKLFLKMLPSLIITLSTQISFAGKEGNGGDAVFLTNNSIMLLDLAEDPTWESKFFETMQKFAAGANVDYQDIQKESAYKSEFLSVALRIGKKSPTLYNDLINEAKIIKWGFITGQDLPELSDEGILESSFLKKQLGIQFNDIVLVNRDLYEKLSNDRQRAAFFVHEIFIHIAKKYKKIDSASIRRSVRYVFPKNNGEGADIESASDAEAAHFFREVVLPGHSFWTVSELADYEKEQALRREIEQQERIKQETFAFVINFFKTNPEHFRNFWCERYSMRPNRTIWKFTNPIIDAYNKSSLPKKDLTKLGDLLIEYTYDGGVYNLEDVIPILQIILVRDL